AEHINAGLPVLRPVVSQAGHRVHPGQPNCCLVVTDLRGSRGETLVQGPVALFGKRSVQLLALLRERPVQVLTLLFQRLLGVSVGGTTAEILRSQRTDQGEDADAGCDDRCGDLRTHKRKPIADRCASNTGNRGLSLREDAEAFGQLAEFGSWPEAGELEEIAGDCPGYP